MVSSEANSITGICIVGNTRAELIVFIHTMFLHFARHSHATIKPQNDTIQHDILDA